MLLFIYIIIIKYLHDIIIDEKKKKRYLRTKIVSIFLKNQVTHDKNKEKEKKEKYK